MKTVSISKDFKQRATRAVLSIVFFTVVYLLLIAAACALTVACGYGGLFLITARASLATLLLGAGLMSVGLIVVFFLPKFITTSHTTDRSGLVEITREDEPRLFALIQDIVDQTGTQFPKHIYLSADVDASVFYDSGFWSMFLPVKKNLMVGMGLMNTTTIDELKGILAHEFGHFSQRSMKVGSYVHNVNYVIHNMLYDNEGFQKVVSRWASISSYITIFVMLGVRVIMGIQWILKQVYHVVNLNYLALSREMEFHADEVAANVAGARPLASSLLRLNIASQAYNNVLSFYGGKIRENLKPNTIFPQQQFAVESIAHNLELPFENGLPVLSVADSKRMNRSKLEFDDQWSSHPSDEDRIKRLERLGINKPDTQTAHALTILNNREQLEEEVTERLFASIAYTGNTKVHTPAQFREEFTEGLTKSTFNKTYNRFYDELPLGSIALEQLPAEANNKEEELFNEEAIATVHDFIGLESDIAVLNQIAAGTTGVKSYDYDGVRYKANETDNLLRQLQIKLHDVKTSLTDRENRAFGYYFRQATMLNRADEYRKKYEDYLAMQKKAEHYNERIRLMYSSIEFMSETLEVMMVDLQMNTFYVKEKIFRDMLREIQALPYYKEVNADAQDAIAKYLSEEWSYFANEMYNDATLNILLAAMSSTGVAVGNMIFAAKKDFLDFQVSLGPNAAS